jgi:hypothetical protein
MVKIIVGSALGGLVAGGIALLAASQAQGTQPRSALVDPMALAAAQGAAPTVRCAPHQQAVLAHVLVNGREAATLACADQAPRATGPYASAPPMAVPQPVYAQPAPYPYAQPVSYLPAPQPVVQTATRAPATRTVYREQDDVVRYEPDRRSDRRSVAKTTMIIGGSAGAGAGVGAIAGGKKGALIGAAIGGGAASIYEATKR